MAEEEGSEVFNTFRHLSDLRKALFPALRTEFTGDIQHGKNNYAIRHTKSGGVWKDQNPSVQGESTRGSAFHLESAIVSR